MRPRRRAWKKIFDLAGVVDATWGKLKVLALAFTAISAALAAAAWAVLALTGSDPLRVASLVLALAFSVGAIGGAVALWKQQGTTVPPQEALAPAEAQPAAPQPLSVQFSWSADRLQVGIKNDGQSLPSAWINVLVPKDAGHIARMLDDGSRARGSQLETPEELIAGKTSIYWNEIGLPVMGYGVSSLMWFRIGSGFIPEYHPIKFKIGSDELRASVEVVGYAGDPHREATPHATLEDNPSARAVIQTQPVLAAGDGRYGEVRATVEAGLDAMQSPTSSSVDWAEKGREMLEAVEGVQARTWLKKHLENGWALRKRNLDPEPTGVVLAAIHLGHAPNLREQLRKWVVELHVHLKRHFWDELETFATSDISSIVATRASPPKDLVWAFTENLYALDDLVKEQQA